MFVRASALAVSALLVLLAFSALIVGRTAVPPESGAATRVALLGPSGLGPGATGPLALENTWTNLSPTSHPTARLGAGMVYDVRANRILLFGGCCYPHMSNDTWSFDLGTNTWSNRNPARAPTPRYDFGMAYDRAADRTLLFGGGEVMGLSNETWSYDYANNTWTQLFPSRSPSARCSAKLAYDAESDRSILFGGWQTDSPFIVGDTWSYDYEGNSWEELTPASSPPTSNSYGFAYASLEDRMILYEGSQPTTQSFDTNTKTWARIDAVNPPNRAAPSMTYDALADRVIVFGGFTLNPSPLTAETWSLDIDAGVWERRDTVAAPRPRDYASMTFDEAAGVSILFGGSIAVDNGTSSLEASDTWSFRASGLPSAPSAFEVHREGDGVALHWEAPLGSGGTDILNYSVYRGSEPSSLVLLARLGPATYDFVDTGAAGGAYYYALSAVNRVGEGPRTEAFAPAPVILSVTASANVTAGTAPLAVSFRAGVTGGRTPYRIAWDFGDMGSATTADCAHTFLLPGNYTVTLRVRDANDVVNTTTLAIHASAPAAAPPPPETSPVTLNEPLVVPVWVWAAVIVAIGVCAVAATWLWRRRSGAKG